MVLVLFERSQQIVKELIKNGIEAYSVDIEETLGPYKDKHIIADLSIYDGATDSLSSKERYSQNSITIRILFEALNKQISLRQNLISQSGKIVAVDTSNIKAIIAHPPCTYLCNSGYRWVYQDTERWPHMILAERTFLYYANLKVPFSIIENPVGVMSTKFRKPDCIIQPWQFGDSFNDKFCKRTCLWINTREKLEPVITVKPEMHYRYYRLKSGKITRYNSEFITHRKHDDNGYSASITPPGIAREIVKQFEKRLHGF